jgi:putative ABC transport system substrate-binding protein
MTRRIGRRTFAAGLTGLAVCLATFGLPGASDAQQPAAPRRIAVLSVSFSPEGKEAQAFRQGLLDAGYSEGRDVVIEWRFANGNYDRVPGLAADLVQRKVDVIVVDGTVVAQGVKRATSTIPIVMALVADPVAAGLVTSLAHPGGNVTGLSMMIPELSAKRLHLLKEIDPQLARAAVLWNPASPFHAQVIEELKAASPSLGIELSFIRVQKPEQIDPAFSAVMRAHAQALYVMEDTVIYTHRMTLLNLVSKARIPAIYNVRRFVDDGGLISYGTNYDDLFRRSAGYVDKILKGAKPANLPVEQPIKFDLVVNLRTAKALGLTMPQSILLQADEVIK